MTMAIEDKETGKAKPTKKLSEAELRRLAHERVWGSPSDADAPSPFRKVKVVADLTESDKSGSKPAD